MDALLAVLVLQVVAIGVATSQEPAWWFNQPEASDFNAFVVDSPEVELYSPSQEDNTSEESEGDVYSASQEDNSEDAPPLVDDLYSQSQEDNIDVESKENEIDISGESSEEGRLHVPLTVFGKGGSHCADDKELDNDSKKCRPLLKTNPTRSPLLLDRSTTRPRRTRPTRATPP